MNDYREIDLVLTRWAEARGLHVYTGHKQNVVRSITVYDWNGTRHDSTGHIWLDPPNELDVCAVHAAAGGFRFDEAVPVKNLSAALDLAAERLAENMRLAQRATMH